LLGGIDKFLYVANIRYQKISSSEIVTCYSSDCLEKFEEFLRRIMPPTHFWEGSLVQEDFSLTINPLNLRRPELWRIICYSQNSKFTQLGGFVVTK
jgi:hypothetical protein